MTQNFDRIGVQLLVQGQAKYESDLRAAQSQIQTFTRIIDRDWGGASTRYISRAEAMSRVTKLLQADLARLSSQSIPTAAGAGGAGGGNRPPSSPLFAGGDFDAPLRKNTSFFAREQAAAAKESILLTKALGDQQAAFSGLNPHMAASIFYTQQVGAGFITLRGAAGLAALSLSTLIQQLIAVGRTALEFESNMAQVQQVTGLSARNFRVLSEDIRRLSRELPFTAAEIGKVVTEASRAGIEGRDNLQKFSKAMLDFGIITNITAEQATLDFAHLALAFQHPTGRIDELTSAVAALDKEFPTSSREIVNFSLRIAAAGKVTGFTAGQVFGIATAMTSLGIRAEAGGTAVQRVMFAIAGAVNDGGETIANFAKVARVSQQEFIALWKSDPAEAFIKFTEGLGRVGDQAQTVLKELELDDVRLIRAFATTAGAGDLLRRSVELGAEAMGKSTLAAERAAIVYATTESQVKRLQNALNDNAIEIGTSLLPAYRDFLTMIVGNLLPALDTFSKALATDAIPQILATARAVGSVLDPNMRDASVAAKDLSNDIRDLGVTVVTEGGKAISWAQELADRIHQAHLFAVILNQTVRAQNLESLARQTRDADKRAEIEREAARFREHAKATAQQIADIDARIADTGQLRAGLERDIARSRAAQLVSSQREINIRSQAAGFRGFDLAETQAQIAAINKSIAGYEAQILALRKYGASTDSTQGSVAELTAEINLQRGVLEHLKQQELDLIKTARQFPQIGDRTDFSGFGDDAKDATAALNKWKQEFDALTKTLLDGLIPALKAASGIIGEQFTGSVQRAALDTTGALTDALLRQAAIIGGPYGAALVAVAQSIASVTAATRELGDVQDAQFVTAESLLGQLGSAAALLQTLALANGDTAKAATQAQAAIDKLRTQFSRLTPEQQKVAGAILDAAEALVAQAAAAGDNEDAQRVYKEGIDAAISAAKDYVDAVDEMTAADKRRADASKTAAEKLAEAMAAESRANENLTKQNERLAAAQKALAEARKSGDPVAIKAAALEAALAKEAVNRAKERVRSRREETKEAEVDVAETGAAKGGEQSAADLRREELDEAAARKKREDRRLPAADRRKLAALQAPTFFEGTVPLRVGASIPGVSDIPLRAAAMGGSQTDNSRNVTVNANYQVQPEIEIKHDLAALSMMGLI